MALALINAIGADLTSQVISERLSKAAGIFIFIFVFIFRFVFMCILLYKKQVCGSMNITASLDLKRMRLPNIVSTRSHEMLANFAVWKSRISAPKKRTL